MSYGNQRDHEFLDRHALRDILLQLRDSSTETSQAPISLSAHLNELKSHCDSQLEKDWLDYLAQRDHRLPTTAQKFYQQCATKPDFVYEPHHTAIYIDGPPHDFPDRQQRDKEKTSAMEDLGITVLRFHHAEQWDETIAQFPHVFGVSRKATMQPVEVEVEVEASNSAIDLELFEPDWHSFVTDLIADGPDELEIEPGGDVESNGRVVGMFELQLLLEGKEVFVVDTRSDSVGVIVATLQSQNHQVLAIDPTQPDSLNAAKIIMGLSQ